MAAPLCRQCRSRPQSTGRRRGGTSAHHKSSPFSDTSSQLLPHADVIFLCTTTFSSLSSSPTSQINSTPTPRAILLALARHAPPHALLVLNAGQEGAALLSLPTREYLQSSGWSPPPRSPSPHGHTYSNSTATSANGTQNWDGVESVRSGSEFWASAQAGNISLASGDSAYTDHGDNSKGRDGGYRSHRHNCSGESFHPFDDGDVGDEGDDGDEQGEDGRHTPQPRKRETVAQQDGLDEEGAHCAFVAGMIWALSRRLLPGPPYAPGCHTNGNGEARKDGGTGDLGVRWRLDECLRYVGLGQDSRRRTNAARANTGSLQNLRVAEHTRV